MRVSSVETYLAQHYARDLTRRNGFRAATGHEIEHVSRARVALFRRWFSGGLAAFSFSYDSTAQKSHEAELNNRKGVRQEILKFQLSD